MLSGECNLRVVCVCVDEGGAILGRAQRMCVVQDGVLSRGVLCRGCVLSRVLCCLGV